MRKSKEEIKLVRDWLKFANENLTFARSGMDEDYPPYHTICYLCQGSSEKYLKAFLIWNGWKLKKILDMEELLAFYLDFDPDFHILEKECGLLNEYITEARYPGDLPFESIGKTEAVEAIEAANQIEKFLLEKIDFPFDDGNEDLFLKET